MLLSNFPPPSQLFPDSEDDLRDAVQTVSIIANKLASGESVFSRTIDANDHDTSN